MAVCKMLNRPIMVFYGDKLYTLSSGGGVYAVE